MPTNTNICRQFKVNVSLMTLATEVLLMLANWKKFLTGSFILLMVFIRKITLWEYCNSLLND